MKWEDKPMSYIISRPCIVDSSKTCHKNDFLTISYHLKVIISFRSHAYGAVDTGTPCQLSHISYIFHAKPDTLLSSLF